MGRVAILLVLFALLASALAGIEAKDFEDCAALVDRTPELESFRCYWMIARRTGQQREALTALDRLAESRGEDPRIDLYRATILGDLGDPAAAEAAARAAAGCESAEEWTCATYANLNLAWHRRRDPEAAREILRAARRTALRADDPMLLARVDVGLGWRAITDQDYAVARGAFERAFAALGPDGPFDARNSSLSGLGYQAWATSRRQEALDYFRLQAVEARAAGDRFMEAEALYNALFVELEVLAETDPQAFLPEDRIEEALAAAERAGNAASAGWLHLLFSRNGVSADREAAELERALGLGRSSGEVELVTSAWRQQALQLAGTGRLEEAIAKLSESLELSRSLGDTEQALYTLELRAELLFRLQDLPRARRDVAQALAELDRLLARQPLALDRAGVFTRFAGGPYVFAHALTEQGEVDEAVAVIERLRDRPVLAELVPEASPDTEKAAAVDREIAALRQQLYLTEDSTRRAELRKRLTELESTAESAGSAPRAAPTLDQLQANLDDETAILSFQIPPWSDSPGAHRTAAWLLLIRRGVSRVLPLPPEAELAPAVRAYRGLLQRDDAVERQAAARLGNWLLADALADLPPGVRQFVVVPDVPLHDLPFAALRAAPDLPPLGERFTFTQVASLGAWLRRSSGPAPALPARTVVLADPTTPQGTDRPQLEGSIAPLRESLLASLPGARREAAALTRTFGGDAVVFLGPEASEISLKSADLVNLGLLYFAAHGVVDVDHPERSALLLTAGGGEDGHLRLREIASLHLNGALVVLAACHSAEGKSFPAQGVFSLARAFLDAGASAVVGNVREVDDATAPLVMRELTANLGRGLPVAEALALAQRRAIDDGLPPAAWASAVVIGDGRAHLEPVPTTILSWQAILAAAAMVTLAVAGLALFRRKSL